jgi:pSer/pThr/pTyr-binding forkhead associated (FHA) protein
MARAIQLSDSHDTSTPGVIQIEVGGRRHAVSAGEFVLGSDPGAGIQLQGPDVLTRHAIVEFLTTGEAAIRVASPAAEVRVNGVRLGAEPTPLLHGDKITLAGHELRVVDEARSGSTQMMAAFAFPDAAPAPLPGVTGPTAAGRLVSLTDGREYTITGSGLVFGRDAGCEVVIVSTEVSRRHAEILPGPNGYVITDLSANGTIVNGQRIPGSRVLARGDVIRIGGEEFRFYAQPVAGIAPPIISGPAIGASQRLNDTFHGLPTRPASLPSVPALTDTLHGIPPLATPASSPAAETPVPAAVPPLASLLIRGGALKGKRLPVRAPVVNIGRADYNDIVLPEPSVSTAHAKLQRREGVWVISDLDSTNGTTVDGEPVKGEFPLSPGATIRFGEVAVLFEPMDAAADAHASGTRVMPRIDIAPLPAMPAAAAPPPVAADATAVRPPRPAPPRRTVVSAPARKSPVSTWALALFVILAAVAAALVLLR